ncbi:DUF1744-domain-containing protein [Sistotremastrum niveocremeum HHB9708]|uniref:DNA polymerase epsilon catalytic subunit n=1 Tax=Sistotremastrum niveocremeum HHB9708 TaxID=1314777 RepID=A0A164PYJ4_9AGAM|nr:DUF1744-domain-containing protein [Sistotremastrum niveocremeum HHB9708]
MARGGFGGGNRKTFGLTSQSQWRGRGSYRGGRGRGRGRGGGNNNNLPAPERQDDATLLQERFEEIRIRDEVDEKMGFPRIMEGPKKEGWLVNMAPTLVKDPDWPGGKSAVEFYFIENDGSLFKTTLVQEPYFYIAAKSGMETMVEEYLLKKYEGTLFRVVRDKKEDLKLPNHLLGHRRLYLQLCFRNVSDLLTVRRDLLPLAQANAAKIDAVDAYAEVVHAEMHIEIDEDVEASKAAKDPRDAIIDIREYDVPYYLRVAIDQDIRAGLWYAVTFVDGKPLFHHLADRVKRAEPVVMAYDIETTKAPLKFPDQAIDQVMMISYMIDGQGFLITNRDIVSEDIEDFEYTPKDGYEGPFTIFNEADEEAVLRRWFEHIRTARPTVMATFNGDFFDFPFVAARAKVHGLDLYLETGFAIDSEEEFRSRTCVHMDCFRWVKRDSYLPQGSQGLKAVTVAKLGYNPIELDPELMTPYAVEQPQVLAQYSVSDAVATYYLYMKYVNPFIFSLCNIIPLNPDEVLRKGSGTLCETLLMVEAYRGNIIMPNRHEEEHGNMFEGHLIASETYVGGHVEALEAGVFRSDIPTHFKIDKTAAQELIDQLDAALKFCIEEESKSSLDQVANYDEVKQQITEALEEMRDNNIRSDKPLIYHLDVAAMYPNIMLSNRLQPDSVVDESVCAVCDYNRPGKQCDRRMKWAWRGEYFPAHRDEFNMVKHALDQEQFPPKRPNDPKRRFHDLSPAEQSALLHKRLGDYSRKVYKKTKETKVIERESIICQKENPFYIDTVRRFRDRRYEYKGLLKTWKKNLEGAISGGKPIAEIEEAKKLTVIYDSLQLAHKCILNSFYGYVMRKGARWHSMEMAGITCLTGATIIQMARQLVERIGRPLELDTDGIWCMLPSIFPENFKFKLKSGKSIAFSYPCTMLNHLVYDGFTNHQYHDLDPDTGEYKIHSENSIFFELDGPYKAMILPSSKEEDKLLKKRYAVFNDDGSLAELKGFEVKRRGELQLIKIFQSQLFERFLLGTTTEECYAAVAEVADRWLDVLFTKGESLEDDELVELIAENRSMSKTLAEYGAQKSTSISTAKRLAEFLGNQMVKDKGLACKFIISARPMGAPVTERAIPVAIFSAEESVKRTYLRKWLKDNSLANFELRSILDWNYYIERLGSVVQKLITIPAAMQKVSNPVPRIHHPDWLQRRVAAMDDKFQQHKMTDFFKKEDRPRREVADIEDFGDEDDEAPSKRGASEERTVAPVPAPKPLPDPSRNYRAWLRAMRPRWKERLEARAAGSGTLVPSMFRGVKAKAVPSTWDILQIRPGRGHGKFIMWLSLANELVAIPLRIQREFYINFKTSPDDGLFLPDYTHEAVTRTLPQNRPCLFLTKVTVAEFFYHEAESHFMHLTSNSDIDGIYERQVPLVVRALLKLGLRCSASQPDFTLNRARNVGFDLQQLETSASSKQRPYLADRPKFEPVFLFHASSSDSRIHVFALFDPVGGARIHIIDPSSQRQRLVQLQETYAEFWKQRPTTETLVKPPKNVSFETVYHGSLSTAFKGLTRELNNLENQSHVLVISSHKDVDYYEANISNLIKFPVFMMAGPKKAHSLDGLLWQKDVSKKMFSRYIFLGRWLYELTEKAKYFNVPLGNIDGEDSLSCQDLDFARRLVKQDMLLWWSPLPKPDLGGVEDLNTVVEEPKNPEYCTPGLYTNVSIAVNMYNLAINSVIQSSLVNEMEGSGGTTAFDASHILEDYTNKGPQTALTLGESATSVQVFQTLKTMVKTWVIDAHRIPGGPAELSVEHFWRWLCSSASAMHDPSLQRFVHGLMKKTFYQLLAEFKRLGSNVIYADFNTIWLVTSKPPGAAYAYSTYITTAATSHDLFRHILLRTETYYNFLLFLDNANYGAIVCENPEEDKLPEDGLPLAMSWNIAAFLPPAFQPHFRQAVAFFIVEMAMIKTRQNGGLRMPLRVLQNLTQDTAPSQDAAKIKELEVSQAFIAERLTRKLLSMVSKVIHEHQAAIMNNPTLPTEHRFPILPGSHINMEDPAFEFVKFVCAAFSPASKDYGNELGILRRNLLEIVGVKEFNDAAIFKNPCEPFKLPMVICQFCDHVRDFDFCRDQELMTSTGPSARWLCPMCDGEYDRLAIEFMLVSCVDKIIELFGAQDLRCHRCKQSRAENVSRSCTYCSGHYELTVNKVELRRRLRTIVNISIVHGLDKLKSYAQNVYDSWQ